MASASASACSGIVVRNAFSRGFDLLDPAQEQLDELARLRLAKADQLGQRRRARRMQASWSAVVVTAR